MGLGCRQTFFFSESDAAARQIQLTRRGVLSGLNINCETNAFVRVHLPAALQFSREHPDWSIFSMRRFRFTIARLVDALCLRARGRTWPQKSPCPCVRRLKINRSPIWWQEKAPENGPEWANAPLHKRPPWARHPAHAAARR